MKGKQMEIVEKRLDEIKPYDNNPRLNDAAVPAVVESLKKFGWQQPIVIDRNGIIVCGHTRYKAALELGMKTAPCKYADELTDEEITAYRLADNKTAELAEWDADKMNEELAKCSKFDMSAFGFDEEEPEDPNDTVEDDYDENVLAEHPFVVQLRLRFDVFGALVCGDATHEIDIEKLLGGVLPKLVFTDPPYGVSIGDKNKTLNKYNGGNSIEENIMGDTLGRDELHDMLVAAFRNLKAHCAEDCAYYVTAPQDGDLGLMMMMMRDAGLEVKHNLVWVKNAATFSMGRLDYNYRHEPIFYTWDKKHNFYGDYDTTVIDKMTKAELKEVVRAYQAKEPDSVIYCDKPRACDLHPTMKPIKLIARFLINSSRKGEPVADIFGGSGSTMIACEQLSRRCYMMELDPHYCDVIIDRWEKFTGNKAELIND